MGGSGEPPQVLEYTPVPYDNAQLPQDVRLSENAAFCTHVAADTGGDGGAGAAQLTVSGPLMITVCAVPLLAAEKYTLKLVGNVTGTARAPGKTGRPPACHVSRPL